MIARVTGMGKRFPLSPAPPVHPVFTKYTLEPKSSIRSISSFAYIPALRGIKGAPKHVEKVGLIPAAAPSSVDPTLAV